MKSFFLIEYIGLILFFQSCSVEPRNINYGQDHCHFCDMTVVDQTHAAEFVTKKGKVYVFDAIECMVRYIAQNNIEADLSLILVIDYDNPGELINASDATFLISLAIKSPMGANLTAFDNPQSAKTIAKEKSGDVLNWEELILKYDNQSQKYHCNFLFISFT